MALFFRPRDGPESNQRKHKLSNPFLSILILKTDERTIRNHTKINQEKTISRCDFPSIFSSFGRPKTMKKGFSPKRGAYFTNFSFSKTMQENNWKPGQHHPLIYIKTSETKADNTPRKWYQNYCILEPAACQKWLHNYWFDIKKIFKIKSPLLPYLFFCKINVIRRYVYTNIIDIFR